MRVGSLALAAALSLASFAASAQDAPLQIFTVKNELTRWRGDGLRDAQGRVALVPAGLLTALANGGFLAQRDDAFWLYDARGARVGGPYDSLEAVDPALDALIVGVGGNPVLGGDGGLIDGSGRELMAPVYKGFRYLPGTQLFAFEQARRWGLADARGRVVVKPTLDGISDAPGAVLVGDAGQQGLIDRAGRYVVPLGASTVSSLNDSAGAATGYFDVCDQAGAVCRGVDSAGRPIFGGRSFSGATFHRDMSRWVITDALEPADAAASDAPAAIGVGITPRKVIADEQGRTLATFDCDYLYRVGGLFRAARAKDDTGGCIWGLVDRDGQWRVPARYNSIETVRDAAGVKAGAAVADDYVVGIDSEDGKRLYGVLAADGSEILAPRYEQVFNRYPELGLYVVQQNRKVGLVDRQGRWRLEPTYGETGTNTDLHPPYLLLSDRDDDGDGPRRERDTIVDARTGKPVFASDYDYLGVEYDFRWEKLGLPWEEFAVVVASRNGKYGVLDLQGRVVVPLKYDNLQGMDAWGRLQPTLNERDLPLVSGLDAQRSTRLHDAVSRQLRAEPAPYASPWTPYAGRYVPADYRSAEQVRAAVAAGRLSRAVAPMLLLDEDAAIVDLDMIAGRQRPSFDFVQYYCARDQGFDLLLPLSAGVEEACEDPAAPKLEFRAGADESWNCGNCAKSGLPSRWVRIDPAADPAMP
ncbi:WG repeat-containing protein [Lysobacter sp. 5GHs7-4]|uniref:WG repeat-containing protein n=1 Tax=Lysobacter sp. 5GHs7-4 TaxID=2904253 RepID=UPI001E37C419|nr:WG repeat-containing protein [Lysobacter sp. 5GHs7-4]UHQ24045.1 WG repeat-containing protein [Lysobacter sp. 5GHs7-4]